MRASVLLIVFVVGVATAVEFSRFKREIQVRSGLISRQKREFPFDDTTTASCEDKCDQTLIENVNKTGFEGTEDPFGFLSLNISGLNAVCTQFQNSKSCYAECFDSSSTFKIYSMMCDDKKEELIHHLPCFQKGLNVSETVCEAKCGDIELLMNSSSLEMEQVAAEPMPDMSSLRKVFDSMGPLCQESEGTISGNGDVTKLVAIIHSLQFLQCAVTCGADVFTKQCPEDPQAGPFFRDFSMAGATSGIQDLDKLDVMIGMHMLPSECSEIIHPGGGTGDENHSESQDFSDSESHDYSNSDSSGMSEVQKEIMDKTSVVLDKTSRNLDLEMEKMKLEMKLMEKKM